MERREFIKLSGLGFGAASLPVFGNPVNQIDPAHPLAFSTKKELSEAALKRGKQLGASYVDIRIGRYLNQSIQTREQRVQGITNTESYGVGIRVICKDTWGFAATNQVTPKAVMDTVEQAVQIAKANAILQLEPVKLAPVKGVGDVQWRTPIELNGFEVPIATKVEQLLEANHAALASGANFVRNALFLVNEQKFFASTDGSFIDQDVHRIWPTFTVTAIDKASGRFNTRNALSSPMGMGYEYLSADAKEEFGTEQVTVYRNRYNMLKDVKDAAKQVKEKLSAKSVKPGKYDLVLDPSHLFLTIHESVGHPLELDRVLGYEANYAGTSFDTLDKWQTKNFQYGSDKVNFVADKTQDNSLGRVAYDDEGVATKEWDLVRDGKLVNYQATRDQVHMIDQNESHGCCYAQSWSDVQFQRMPNVSLEAGKQKLALADMIKDVEKGIYIVGRGSYSIDQQRYNFQFGGQLFFEIEQGKITQQLSDVAYQSNTQDFWNACSQICDQSDYRLGGSFFDGKGQPSQVSAVSHGCSTTRFDGINVINTARKV